MFSLLAIPLGIAPTLVWLFVYLRKDLHPEPRFMLALTFLGGIAIAPVALFAESGALAALERLLPQGLVRDVVILFLITAFIEEFLKFSVLRFLVIHSRAFDEAVDAMIYLITAALGFAAIENVLILGDLLPVNLSQALVTGTLRFWGANFLHALSSATLGYFFVRGFWGRGLLWATLFHGFFNGAIVLKAEVGVPIVIFLLGSMAILVSVFFGRLVKRNPGYSFVKT